jgi:LysR family nitrogen assimilation transcriptional regulator
MELRQLRSFVHIAELGSFSLAAERLHIVQPALTRQIQSLETELGVRLLVRHGRGVILTPQGEALSLRAIAILREVEQVGSDIRNDGKYLSGEISFGMPPTVAEVLSGALIEKFARHHPHVKLKVVSAYSGHVLDWLQKGVLDLAVLYENKTLPLIRSRALITEELMLVENCQAAQPGEPITFVAATALKLILPSPVHGLRQLIDATAARHGVLINPVVETDSLPVQIDLVKRGFAATILPLAPVFEEVASGRLSVRAIIEPELSRNLLLATPGDRPQKAASRVFADMIIAEVHELADSGRWRGRVFEQSENG